MGTTTLSAQLKDDTLINEWERWKDERGFDSKSEALRGLMRKTLVEEQSANTDSPDESVIRGVGAGVISLWLGQTYLIHGLVAAATMFVVCLAIIGIVVHASSRGET